VRANLIHAVVNSLSLNHYQVSMKEGSIVSLADKNLKSFFIAFLSEAKTAPARRGVDPQH
jgi:hypothetical protein